MNKEKFEGFNGFDDLLIGYCGICCSLCYAYRSKKCPGCSDTGCKIVKCAISRKQRYCFLCDDFPCNLFEDGFEWDLSEFISPEEAGLGIARWKPYSEVYIKLFKYWKNQD